MGIYLATAVTAAIIAIGIWAFIGLNRQEQARLRQLAAPAAEDLDARGEGAEAVGGPDGVPQA